jgi:YggT family protein
MFVITAFINALEGLFDTIVKLLELIIVIRVIISWVNADPYNNIVQVIYRISDPFLRPFQKLLPAWRLGGLDLSPVFAFFCLEFIREIVDHLLMELSGYLH